MKVHLEKECLEVDMECPFEIVGCKFKVRERNYLLVTERGKKSFLVANSFVNKNRSDKYLGQGNNFILSSLFVCDIN